MKQYILLRPDEDGNCVSILNPEEIEDINQLMEDYGIHTWVETFTENENPQYWDEHEAMLLEVDIKVPKPVTVVEKYKL